MKESVFQVVGFKVVRVIATDTLGEVINPTGLRIQPAKLSVSREAVTLTIPALRNSPLIPMDRFSYTPGGEHFGAAFDSLYPADVWGPVVFAGIRAARVIRTLLQWELPRRGRGSPKRGSGWNGDREEIFALVLRYSDYGAGEVTRAITLASNLHPELFERAYQGDDPLESARRDFYRRIKEFEAVPDSALPVGRILMMEFDFEKSD